MVCMRLTRRFMPIFLGAVLVFIGCVGYLAAQDSGGRFHLQRGFRNHGAQRVWGAGCEVVDGIRWDARNCWLGDFGQQRQPGLCGTASDRSPARAGATLLSG